MPARAARPAERAWTHVRDAPDLSDGRGERRRPECVGGTRRPNLPEDAFLTPDPVSGDYPPGWGPAGTPADARDGEPLSAPVRVYTRHVKRQCDVSPRFRKLSPV